MLQSTAHRDGFAVHSLAYYQHAYDLFHPSGMCELLMAESEGQPLAALMVFMRGARAWYVYGGSTDLLREKMPNYLLQWEAMRWARERGCTEYDLWGVPDEDEAVLEEGFADRQRRPVGRVPVQTRLWRVRYTAPRHPWIESSVRCCIACTCSSQPAGLLA